MEAIETESHFRVRRDLVAGTVSGVFIAGFFNPYDRALYLSVKDQRPFLHRANWLRPWEGFGQACVQRTISGGLYFVLQQQTREHLEPTLRRALGDNFTRDQLQLGVGIIAGGMNGMMLNQLATIKYHAWGQEESTRFLAAARQMSAGGLRPFFKGIGATAVRDVFFGVTYELLRNDFYVVTRRPISGMKEAGKRATADLLAACAATLVSSPFNYVRNIKYATMPTLRPKTSYQILKELYFSSVRSEAPLR